MVTKNFTKNFYKFQKKKKLLGNSCYNPVAVTIWTVCSKRVNAFE